MAKVAPKPSFTIPPRVSKRAQASFYFLTVKPAHLARWKGAMASCRYGRTRKNLGTVKAGTAMPPGVGESSGVAKAGIVATPEATGPSGVAGAEPMMPPESEESSRVTGAGTVVLGVEEPSGVSKVGTAVLPEPEASSAKLENLLILLIVSIS